MDLIALLIKKLLDWPAGTGEGIGFIFLCFLAFSIIALAVCLAIDRLFLPKRYVSCEVMCKEIVKVSPMQITMWRPGFIPNYFLLLDYNGNPVPVRVDEQYYNHVSLGSKVNTICRQGRLFEVITIEVV